MVNGLLGLGKGGGKEDMTGACSVGLVLRNNTLERVNGWKQIGPTDKKNG